MYLYLPIYTPTVDKTPPIEVLQMLEKKDVIFIVCFSGGKDSVAMVLYLLELGVPKERIELHHHEVDGRGDDLFDWHCTTSYCIAFAKALGLKLYFSYREGGIKREIYRENEGLQDVLYQEEPNKPFIRLKSKKGNSTKRKFPAVRADLMTRWCSSVVKIDVLRRIIANSPRLQDRSRTYVICTGERRAESTKRSTYQQVEQYSAYSAKLGRNAWQWRPVLEWSDDDVWRIMKRWRIQAHPCYMLGWSRCSCQLCIFGSANTWASLWALSEDKVFEIAEIEMEIGNTLYHKETILERAERGTSFLIPQNVKRWASEALGEFTSPIILPEGETWVLPQGASSQEVAGAV